MNPGQLLDHFDRIGDAPDVIPRLRRFILSLAVRGKLVEQDVQDEPASELLNRTRMGKTRLIKKGVIRRVKELTPIDPSQMPVKLPSSWTWTLTETISQAIVDCPHSTPIFVPTGIACIDTNCFKAGALIPRKIRYVSETTYFERIRRIAPRAGDVIFAREGSVGPSVIVPDGLKCCLGQRVMLFRLMRSVLPAYFSLALSEDSSLSRLLALHKGIGASHVNVEDMRRAVIPLPPAAEQQRIVSKVEELMVLCDRLEAAQAERERRRDRLVAASLQRLNEPADAPAFPEHADFHLRHLPRLTTRPDQVPALREAILNIAVRGRLVEQDPDDEPASELLKRSQAEKERLARDGKIKRNLARCPVADTEEPFQLRDGWTWARFEDVFTSITDGDHLPPPKADTGIPLLVIGNVKSQSIDFSGCRHVAESYYRALDITRRPTMGDLLYTLVGSYGIPALVRDDRPFCVQRHIGILRPSQCIDTRFLARALESRFVFDQATSCATGIAQKTVPLSGLRRMLLPIPPLAEQHRIVAKVEELMTVCNQLEAQLTIAQTERRRLLEAVLRDALQPAGDSSAVATLR